MASSRSSPPAERGAPARPKAEAERDGAARAQPAVRERVAAAIREAIAPFVDATAGRPLRIAVALSGGRDSMVLLDALGALRAGTPIAVCAVHVHHGLSPNADAWAEFCAAECAHRDIALTVHRVRVERAPGASLEATARDARLAALGATDVDLVALAHHADDQAETLLLQLLRGAGPHGLAAMGAVRESVSPAFVRPLLALPRAALETYARRHALRWIDDESNADTGLKRNYLRHEIAPRLATAFPGFPGTLVRAAAHQAEAAQLLDELAALDADGALAPGADGAATLERGRLAVLAARSPARARNLLRWFVRGHGLQPPSTARLAAMLTQLTRAAPDARVRLAHAGIELGIYRERIVVHAPAVAPFVAAWSGESALELPHGVLEFAAAQGEGLARRALHAARVTVRGREGGERLQIAARGPARALKRLLQDAHVPPWQRAALPLVFCDDTLAAVPGVGVDATLRTPAGAPGIVIRWHPR